MYGYSENCHLALVLEILAIEQYKIINQHRWKVNEESMLSNVCSFSILFVVVRWLVYDFIATFNNISVIS
jgi:hypothetical protein